MNKLRPHDIAILEKMSDNSGWSASQLGKIIETSKGNILARNLQKMEEEKIIFKGNPRITKNNQKELPYYIIEDINIFGFIVGQLAETEEYVDEPVKIMDGVVYADSSEGNFAALKSNGELWAIGMPYKAISYPPDPENASAEEELLYSRLPHKILDGVLVSGAF